MGRSHSSEHENVLEEGACCLKRHGGHFVIPVIWKIEALSRGRQWVEVISCTSEEGVFVDHEGRSALKGQELIETPACIK